MKLPQLLLDISLNSSSVITISLSSNFRNSRFLARFDRFKMKDDFEMVFLEICRFNRKKEFTISL